MPRLGRGPRSAAAALGLVACSALLIHFWDGQIEGHFHFFVVVSLLILYQDWLPSHRGRLRRPASRRARLVLPNTVYSTQNATAHPWSWAFIHGAFILAASAANIVSWRLTEHLLRDLLTGLAGRAISSTACASACGARTADAARGRHLPRPRSLQGPQRLARPRRGRPRPRHRERAPARRGARERHGGALRRRRVRLVCEDLRDSEEAVGVAERLIAALREPYVVDGHEIVLTVSAGIAVGGRDDNRSAEDLIRDADAAMYRAKENGKDRYVVFGEEMRARALTRLADEPDLRYALRRGELHVRYEPQFALGSGRVRALEALVHWQHPTRGLLGPRDFMATAEETGMVVPIGEWAIGEACRQLAGGRQARATPDLGVSINVSAYQLRDTALRRDGRGMRCAPATSSRRRCAWRSPSRRSWPTRARP